MPRPIPDARDWVALTIAKRAVAIRKQYDRSGGSDWALEQHPLESASER